MFAATETERGPAGRGRESHRVDLSSRARPGRLLPALLSLVACVEVRELEPPPDEGARAVLIVFRDAKETVAYATDVTTTLAEALPPFAGPADARDLFVLEWTCPLDRLGLAPGVQQLTAERATYLPPALATFGRSGSAWSRLDDLPAELGAIVARLSPTRALDCPEVTDVEVPAQVEHGIGLADGSVLVGAGEGVFYRVDVDTGAMRWPELSGGYLAAHRTQDELWVVGEFGEVARARIGEAFTSYSGASFPEKTLWVWLDGAAGDAPFELFRLDLRGVMERMVGTEWSKLADLPPRTRNVLIGGITWVGPGEAIAAASTHVAHFRAGEPVRMVESPLSEPDLSAITYVPGVGVIIGGERGALLRLEGDALVRLVAEDLPEGVLGIAPLGEGLVVLQPHRFDYWRGALRACPERSLDAISAVRRLPSERRAAILQRSAVTFFDPPDLAALSAECSGSRPGG